MASLQVKSALIRLGRRAENAPVATVPKGAPPPGHFQQSLGIFDEKGERVRYNLDVDGNRARDYTELPYVDALPNE